MKQNDELNDLGYHLSNNNLELPQKLSYPENISRIAQFVNEQSVLHLKCANVSADCYAAVIELMENCPGLQSVEFCFDEEVGINTRIIAAIKNHPRLFRVKITNLVLNVLNHENIAQLGDVPSIKYTHDRQHREDLEAYIDENREKYEAVLDHELLASISGLFSPRSVAILELPDLFLAGDMSELKEFNKVPYQYQETVRAYLKQFRYREILATIQVDQNLCIIHTCSGKELYNWNVWENKYDGSYPLRSHFQSLFNKLVSEARNNFNHLNLFEAQETLALIQILIKSSEEFNKAAVNAYRQNKLVQSITTID